MKIQNTIKLLSCIISLTLISCGYNDKDSTQRDTEYAESYNLFDTNSNLDKILEDGASKLDTENIISDIELAASSTEVRVGQDSGEIEFTVKLNTDQADLYLIDNENNTSIARFSIDNTSGNYIYKCEYKVDTDIHVDDVTSQSKYHYFYAKYTDKGVTHISDTIQIFVVESFTDTELDNMNKVDEQISEILDYTSAENMALDEKREYTVEKLEKLEAQGLITKGSIYTDSESDMITFEYSCGVSGGVKLEPFNTEFN